VQSFRASASATQDCYMTAGLPCYRPKYGENEKL